MATTFTVPSEQPLADVHELGPAVFGKSSPSERTLRELTRKGVIPHLRIGRLIRYNVAHVRLALEQKCNVRAQKTSAS